jgi:hypothetical protein
VRLDAIADALSRVMPNPLFFPLSAATGEGLPAWTGWLEERRGALSRAEREVHLHPAGLFG